ncbi:MAG TPA: cyclase family protein [Candidatus Polarisedimenticolia bacterium]|nr:cyclase family protein [Candidatus Polarisedimenticolia bacterium]
MPLRRLIEITRPIDRALPSYPGDPPVRLRLVQDPERGGTTRVTSIRMSVHAGTHVDAPCHLSGLSGGVEALPLDAMLGPALVVRAPAALVTPAHLGPAGLLRRSCPPRLLFSGMPVLSAAAARALAHRGVRLIGTDGLSIDPVGGTLLPAHRVLLKAGVVLLEGLDLSGAPPGRYDLIALPLYIPGSDGAPVRALLRKGRPGQARK